MKSSSRGKVIYESHATPIEGLPFIFVHVPKTGGTSVRRALSLCGYNSTTCHQSAAAYIKRNGGDVFSRLPGHAIIRNPYDRIVSAYYFGRDRGPAWPEHRSAAFRETTTFIGFCEYLEKSFTEASELLVIKPQTDYICDLHGNIPLNLWLNEDIGFFWSYLNETYFQNKKVQLHRLNSTRHPNFLECHTDETIRIIGKLYAEDLRIYENVKLQSMEANELVKPRRPNEKQ